MCWAAAGFKHWGLPIVSRHDTVAAVSTLFTHIWDCCLLLRAHLARKVDHGRNGGNGNIVPSCIAWT